MRVGCATFQTTDGVFTPRPYPSHTDRVIANVDKLRDGPSCVAIALIATDRTPVGKPEAALSVRARHSALDAILRDWAPSCNVDVQVYVCEFTSTAFFGLRVEPFERVRKHNSPSNGAGTGTSEFHGERLRSTAFLGGGNVTAPCPCTPTATIITTLAIFECSSVLDVQFKFSDDTTLKGSRQQSVDQSDSSARWP